MYLCLTMKNNPLIIWEKWSNPLIHTEEDVEDESYSDFLDEEEHNQKTTSVMITPLGIIPFEEIKDCDKIFNFWTGHTNFNISNNIANIIEGVDGVETFNIFTRYRFRIGVGKAFQDRDVMANINNKVYQQLE